MVELGIVDIREIIRIINNVYKCDFSNFALTSFKYSLEKVIAQNGLLTAENLFRKLSEEPQFFDKFLNEIFVPSTEMFRDPSLWRWLREEYFPNIALRHFDNFKIWLPICVSGAELYTICILLKEINLLDKVKIIASAFSNESIAYIRSGKYPSKKLEVSIENYRRFQGNTNLESYYKLSNSDAIRDTSLISNVEFIKDDINFSRAPQNIKLILFRNSMIYFNPTLQSTVLDKMSNSLSAAGHFIIGVKESIKSPNSSGMAFEIVNNNESVYKRKI
jgi:chemotaxis protein methyltransferase CheR